MIGEIGLFGVIEATGHVIVIVFGAAIIAYIWNGFHTFFPGIMIGWGVYEFMMNDFQQTPFHYFYDFNAVIADWVFVNHPLPDLLHIPIEAMVGFGLFFICINLVVNN